MARKTNNRPQKFQVAIVGEGETEWFYFNDMRQHESFSFKVEPDLPKHSDYKSIIKTARKKRDKGYDLVFCVLDLDRIMTNETEKKGYFAEKAKILVNKGIEFIETMPCIELWFLLHFLDNYSSKVYLDYNQISAPLKHYIPKYEKTTKFLKPIRLYEFLSKNGNSGRANKFASRLEAEKENSNNPLFNFTQINNLINKLKEK
ncbi:MAG: RloB family protein [Bacteroidales bacterium]|nr:RloB family protein [Bacteroidales bacterium]